MRIKELSDQEAELESENVKLLASLRGAQESLQLLRVENEQLSSFRTSRDSPIEDNITIINPVTEFQRLYVKLKEINSSFDIYGNTKIAFYNYK